MFLAAKLIRAKINHLCCRLHKVAEFVNIAFDFRIGRKVSSPVCSFDRVQIILPKVILLDIEGHVAGFRLLMKLAHVIIRRAKSEIPVLGYAIALCVSLERLDELVEVV